jgi:3-oxoacyl-[acyl-carrier-protein] synthase III
MGTVLEAVAVAELHGNKRGARRLADAAIEACLNEASLEASDLNVLVNVGIYRERNLAEPALAALIQEDVHANPGHPPIGGHGTFSFDLGGGPHGALTAAWLMDGFLGDRSIRHAVIVTSDVDPGGTAPPGFPFVALGGAMILGRSEEIPGFTDFAFEAFPEFEDRFQAEVRWDPMGRRPPIGRHGRNRLAISTMPDYNERVAECSITSALDFLLSKNLTPDRVDLVVTSTPVPGFATALAEGLGIPEDRIAAPPPARHGSHTAGIIAALEEAVRARRFQTAKTTFLVAAGAGISVGMALYLGARA